VIGVELDTAVSAVLTRAEAGEELEAYGLHRAVCAAQAGTGGEIFGVGQTETRGIGVRVVTANRMGYASTADLTEPGLADCVRQARDNARLAAPHPAERLPPAQHVPEMAGLCHADLAGTPIHDKVSLAADLARRATSLDPRVRAVDTAEYREERSTVLIATTTGTRLRHERGFAQLSVDVLGDDGGSSASDYGCATVRSPGDLDVDTIAVEAVRRTTRLLGVRHAAPRGLPVVLDPEVAAVFIAAAGRAFTADAMHPGRGPFAGRRGERVAASCVTLVDDGVDPRFPATAPFDDEGTPRHRTTLIDAGTANAVLHSAATAAAAGTGQVSTGNARRGSHKAPPSVAPTTLIMSADRPIEAVLHHAPEMIYVQQLSAGRSGVNAVTGRIDVGAVGFVMRDGEATYPYQVMPLTSRIQDLVRHIAAIGDDARSIPEMPVAAATLLCGAELLGVPSAH
jgi:PmbA protein